MEPGLRGLQREVMGPRRPVSSSLLLFSAHRHRAEHHHVMVHNRPRPPVVRVEHPAAAPMRPAPPPAECKGPVYRSTADGHTEVVFEQCPARPFAQH